MSKITILHLSDIHFRKKKDEKNKTFRLDVQQKLLQAVETHLKEHETSDVVTVTGDIAFSGKKPQYDEALKFFDELKGLLPKGTPILAVPGNHDVDREQVNQFFSLHRIVNESNTDKFLESPKDIQSSINVKFTDYRAFIDQLNPELYSKDDYFWVKNFKEKNVSFLGLNSAWASEGDSDRFNIALGYSQVMAALEKAKNIPNRVILMHHPPINWLKDMESGRARIELFKKCQLLLHGHNHADNALVYQDPSDSCICLGANASYTNDKDGFIGFQWVKVEFTGKARGVKTTVWPYILEERQNEILPDYNRWRNQKGKPCFVISTEEFPIIEKPGQKPTLKIPEDYKKWVREFHSTLPTDQLARKGEVILISLPQVYIPLETANPFQKTMEKRKIKEKDEAVPHVLEEMGDDGEEGKKSLTVDIEELVSQVNCLLLEGKAGMGKTTLVKHLAYTLIRGSGPQSLRGYLPVLVFLKDFWPLYQKEMKKEAPAVTFASLLEDYFKKVQCPLSTGIVKDFLGQGRALLLLDGLDEVPEEIRSELVDMVHRFRFEYSRNETQEKHKNIENKGNRFLITARPHGIDAKELECFGDYHQKIEYLDDKKVEDFISRWFRAVSGQARGFADLTAGDMISEIRLHEHAAVFIRNPLLLTALCIFYLVGGKRIPDQRADLYDRIVTNLLYRRFHDSLAPERVNQVQEFLMHLAYTMQTRNVKSIEPYEAKEVLKQEHPLKPGESAKAYKKRLDQLFKEIEPVCGLLNRQSSSDIEFAHLTFQEFMAAKHMLDMDIDYKKYLDDSWWEETLLLYTGLMNLEMKKRSNGIVLEIINLKPTRLQLLGCKALRDFQTSKREKPVVKSVKEKLAKLINSSAPLEERFEAGDILGTLEDPRIDILSPPMVHVEAGQFTRGSDEHEREQPIHQVYLDEFMMGKYPVTNREFKAFIRDGGYNNKDLWTPEGWKWRDKENIFEPGLWHDRKWNGPNFPVVRVSWYEAAAYAKWLSQKTGKIYVLPTEARWEKAARGDKGLIYPWGNEFDKNLCNYDECGLDRTSPVGIFPGGESPYGCVDMAGNVWEWCSDWYGPYNAGYQKNPTGPGSGTYRVLRGGGWNNYAVGLRCSFRNSGRPSSRNIIAGFRLCQDN
jgi:formylglycine-generating enzyme required for sulfatase activity/predicted MPP superfamily phosphohydrolase/energy-coupling factor transporter ATP-binding protein EcfA2